MASFDFALKVAGIALLITSIYFLFLVQPVSLFLTNSYLIGTLIYILIYSTIIHYAIHGQPPWSNIRAYAIIGIAFLIFDLIAFPLLITQNGLPPNLPAEAKLSSDIFIYSLIPNVVPEFGKYLIVYPFSFAFGIFMIAMLSKGKTEFKQTVKSNL